MLIIFRNCSDLFLLDIKWLYFILGDLLSNPKRIETIFIYYHYLHVPTDPKNWLAIINTPPAFFYWSSINSFGTKVLRSFTSILIHQIIFEPHLFNLCMLNFSPIHMTFFHFEYFGQQINCTLVVYLPGQFNGIIIGLNGI